MSPAILNPMDAYQSNLDRLQYLHPKLAAKIAAMEASEPFAVEPSKQGCPTLLYQESPQKTISLHSRYNPKQEASRFVDSLETDASSNFIVFGLGLGYHLLELIKRIPTHSKILVVESREEVFKCALGCQHFDELLKHPNIHWMVGRNNYETLNSFSDWSDSFTLNGFTPVRFAPLVQLDLKFYGDFETRLGEIIKETQVAHNTRRALSRLLYQNCLRNLKSAISSPGVANLRNVLKNEAVMIVAAGPSLDKNIQLIRGSQGHCKIIAVSTALKPLQEAGIEADFVVAIDPKPVSCAAFENLNISPKTSLIFNPCIPENIPKQFRGNRFVLDAQPYVWKFLTEGLPSKGELGNGASVAHTALTFALHMGCDPIILVGQDLSFQGSRSHCSGAFHGEFRDQNIGTNQTSGRLQKRQRAGTTPSFEASQDIFGNFITTNKALDAFRFPFEKVEQNGVRLINATEGGLNISNMENTTLKEALSEITTTPSNNSIAVYNQVAPDSEALGFSHNLSHRIKQQSQSFEQLLLTIQNWTARNHSLSEEILNEQASIAEGILATLVADENSVQLLQEYLYSPFLDWNRETYQIELLKDERKKVKRKVERDFILFSEIEKAIKWFNSEFENLP